MDSNEEEIIHRTAALKDEQKRRYLKIIGLIFVACLVGVAVASVTTYYTLKSAAEDGTFLAQQIQQECEKPGTTDPDLEQFCPSAEQVVDKAPETVKVEQVPGPPGSPGTDGTDGTDGTNGSTGPAPSATAVFSAVRRFCTDTGRCDAVDGSDATPAQVAIAVSSYCNSRGQCRGPAGEEGSAGENGTNGSDGEDGIDGADAPPVTQAQLIEAVDAYCAQNNNCRGPAGENGTNGSDGTQGPAGPAGVINVADNCEPAPERMVIDDVSSSYDALSQTVIIDCTYRDMVPGQIP